VTERDAAGGGLTAATGDLTPPSTDEAFDPGERREMEDPDHQADVTSAQTRAASVPDDRAADSMPEVGPTNLAARDGGYGSTTGLAPDDPAYRQERRPDNAERGTSPGRGARIGGDELTDAEERF
jgi:hypothetical protein